MGSRTALDWLKQMYVGHSCATIMGLAALLFMIEFCLIMLVDLFGDVINFYNQAEMVKDGMVPYVDFVFEFPPFAIVFFLIPSMFTSDQNTYGILFGFMMVLMALLCLYYLIRIADKMGINRALVAGVFVALILIYEADLVRKFDAIPMALTVIALFYHTEQRTALAYGLSAFGALVKIYPIMILALFLAIDLANRKDRRSLRIKKGLAACAVVALIAFVPFLAMGVAVPDVLSFLTFQSNRGFQVESLVGVMVQGLGILGLTSFTIVPMYNTWDVAGSIPDALSLSWNLIVFAVMLIMLALIFSRAYKNGSEGTSPRDLTVYALLIVATFIVLNKVFSTQYVLWLFPLIALLPVTADPTADQRLLVMVTLTGLLSMAIFALYNVGEAEFVLVNLARDVMIISLITLAAMYVLGGRGHLGRLYGNRDDGGARSRSSRQLSLFGNRGFSNERIYIE